MSTRSASIFPKIGQLQIAAAVVGLAGLVAVFLLGKDLDFWHSYLLGVLAVTGLTLGCLGLVLLRNLTRGAWAFPLIRFLEAGVAMLPLVLVLFIPILLNLSRIYPWAGAEAGNSEFFKHRSSFLNTNFFIIRTVAYFAYWMFVGFVLIAWNRKQDEDGDPNWAIKRTNFAAPATVFFVITVTIAWTDWIMSLEEHWFSTIFGLLAIVGQALSAMAFVTLLAIHASKYEPFRDVVDRVMRKDWGNLLLTFTILWAYMSFSQYLIIWSGNLPEEITYYLDRREGNWLLVGVALILFHFLLPFFLLLSSRLKRTPRMLANVAGFILFIRAVDWVWTVIPSARRPGLAFQWTDAAALIGVAGIWLAVYIWRLSQIELLPTYDLRATNLEVPEHA